MNPAGVAVFWDLGTCPRSSNLSGYTLVDNIRRIAHKLGIVTSFKAYLELDAPSEHPFTIRSLEFRSELQTSGVSLTDCPRNAGVSILAQMLTVDMVMHAFEHTQPSSSNKILLVSGNRTLAYTMASLRLRKFDIVLLCPSDTHASLKAHACAWLDWDAEVLRSTATAGSTRPRTLSNATTSFAAPGRRTDPAVDFNGQDNSGSSGNADPYLDDDNLTTESPPTHLNSNAQAHEHNHGASPSKPTRPRSDSKPFSDSPALSFQSAQTSIPTSPARFGSLISSGELRTHPFPGSETNEVRQSSFNEQPSPKPDISSATSWSSSRLSSSAAPFTPSTSVNNAASRQGTVIPPRWRILAEALEEKRQLLGQRRIIRFEVGAYLSKYKVKDVYAMAGVNNFGDWVNQAEQDGIIETGGEGTDRWIALRPEWMPTVSGLTW